MQHRGTHKAHQSIAHACLNRWEKFNVINLCWNEFGNFPSNLLLPVGVNHAELDSCDTVLVEMTTITFHMDWL